MKGMQYRFGPFRLVSSTRQIWREGQPIELPRRVFDCLLYLLENRDRAVGRDELVAAVWSRVDVADTQLSQLVRRLRRLLGDDGQVQQTVRTVQGFGYRWALAVEAAPFVPVPPAEDGAPAGAVSDGSPPQPSPSGEGVAARRSRVAAALAIGVAVLLLLGGWRFRHAAAPVADLGTARAVVLPFEVDAPADGAWLRLGGMDMAAERLRGAGLAVPPSESVLAALHGISDQPAPDHLRRAFAAGLLVRGWAVKSAGGWRVTLDSEAPGDLHRRASATAVDPVTATRAAAEQLAAALGRMGRGDSAGADALDARVARVRAALLANEIATARTLLEGASTAETASPLLRYWTARTDFRAGDYERAQATLDALLGEPGAAQDPAWHGRLLVARAGVQVRLGDYARAESDFDQAVALIAPADHPADAAEALAGRGIARVALKQFEAAGADLGAARLQMVRANDAFGATRVDANLGLLELVRQRPAAALPWLASAAARFESFGAVGPLLSTLDAQTDARAMLLEWQAALDLTLRRWTLRERADPMQAYLIGVDRARILAALGRLREADVALDEVESRHPAMRREIAQGLHAQRAELAWRRQDSTAALHHAREALADATCRDTDFPCGPLVLLYQRALLASGAAVDGVQAPAVAALDPAAQQEVDAPVLAVARAEWAVHRGDAAAAEAAFRGAYEAVAESAVPADVAVVADAYARWLMARGRLEEAAAVAGRVALWAERDFDCALLQLAVLRAFGNAGAIAAARGRVESMAGERRVPGGLVGS
jgi:DNA-binding winged helix-turn-helix (wHTH) protein/tetratricopeptide (TPR) repeat protein